MNLLPHLCLTINKLIFDKVFGKRAFLQTGEDLLALPACLFLLFFLQGQVQKPKQAKQILCSVALTTCIAGQTLNHLFDLWTHTKKCPPPYTVQFTTVRMGPWP